MIKAFEETAKTLESTLKSADKTIQSVDKTVKSIDHSVGLDLQDLDQLVNSLTRTTEDLQDVIQEIKAKPWSLIYKEGKGKARRSKRDRTKRSCLERMGIVFVVYERRYR
jgi:uncharacterized protein YoxC